MSADTQGVLLRYAGGEVYALPTADRHVWRVAGVEVHVDRVALHAGTDVVIGLETFDSLASAAAAAHRASVSNAAIAEAEAVLAKYERPRAGRTGKSKRRVAAKGER